VDPHGIGRHDTKSSNASRVRCDNGRMREVVLREEKTATDQRRLIVRVLETGALRIEGWDLGEGVERSFGEGVREYEWTSEVAVEDLPRLITALGGVDGSDVLDVIETACRDRPTRLEATIHELGIQPKFWSRMGD